MIKFKISSDRFAEVCNVLEYLHASAKNKEIIIRIAPRFIVEKDEYIVKVTHDEDGDIEKYEGLDEALSKMLAITPRRLEKLIDEFSEAAKGIVNPPSGTG